MPRNWDNSDLWCWEEARSVSNDGIVAYENRRLSLNRRRDMPPRARVLVRESEDGHLRVFYKTPRATEYELSWKDYLDFKPPLQSKGHSFEGKPSIPGRHPWRRTNMIFSVKP